MARTSHGITKAEYSTDGTTWTEISDVTAENSEITFPDQEENAVSPYGNEYSGVQYAVATIEAKDLTAFDAIKSNWQADTKQYFRFTLSNSATWTWDYGTLLQALRPITIQGQVRGQADIFHLEVQIPYDDITKA